MYEILCLDKSKNTVINVEISNVQELLADKNNVLWIDITNPRSIWPDEQEIHLLMDILNIHRLSVEDCVSERLHPKIEDCENYLFLIIYGLKYENILNFQGAKLLLGSNFIVSYSHEKIDEIEIIKNNFKSRLNHSCSNTIDIFHSIIDHLIDGYLPIIDKFDIQIGKFEEILFKNPFNTKLIKHLNAIREPMNTTRQIIVLENEIFYSIIKNPYSLISDKKNIYFRDIYDHLEKNLTKIENLKESISNLLQMQMNINTQNLSEIMKFLTIISTIFLPANVIAGIFGMNFVNLPFINSTYGHIFAFSLMIVFALTMIFYFKKRKWL
ncbi:MAG: magnesium transporter CorA family protein [Candidatus Gastranaerophilales bacterium]|nr:magnesium transporter CorA family protein [Candidatus Gastranaerophilales bacterium]